MQKTTVEIKRYREGICYQDFINEMFRRADDETDPHREHIRLNLQRSLRIAKIYKPAAEVRRVVRSIEQPQFWMVLTETWCGDSAQILPYLAAMADINSLIQMRILYRDENPDLMDRFLTNGKRSIPKILILNKDGSLLNEWGPRPSTASRIFSQSISAGEPKTTAQKKLHQWYAHNRGRQIEEEFLRTLSQSSAVIAPASH